jgi:serine/threonine protein kinase
MATSPAFLAAGKELQLERVAAPHGEVIKLIGVVDESIDKTRLVEKLAEVTVFDLDGVSRITSYGVREWIKALHSMPLKGSLYFVKCRPCVMAQFNTVAGFAGKGQLVSFYAPYLCNACDHLFEVLLDLRKQHTQLAELMVPPARCPKCHAEAEFDDVVESYLTYVSKTSAPVISPKVNALIDGESSPVRPPFHIQKEVLENATLLWLSGDLDRGGHFKRLAEGLEGEVALISAKVVSGKDAGLRALSTFLQQPNLDLSLPRLPLWLARILAGVPGGCGGARILSFLLPFQCEIHGSFSAEIPASSLRQIPGTFTPPLCPICANAGLLRCTTEELEEIRQLPLSTPSPALAEALRTRPDGPLESSGDSILPSGRDSGDSQKNRSFGRYELIRRIGLGGMAEVFLARQLGPMGFEKRVVLKRILPQFSEHQSFIDMFLSEARLAARVSHSNVVQIFELGQVGNQYFIAMEYVPGKDLALLLRVCKQLSISIPVEVACRLVMGICAGLQAAHSCVDDAGNPLVIIHRDVSPHNVLVSTDGTVKVADFGVAKLANAVGKTEPGVVKGKINYMAPELFIENSAFDARVDVWAAGVILYQLLTQTLPFGRPADAATMHAILEESPVPPSQLRSEVPKTLDRILEKALAKPLKERFPTAVAFQIALEDSLMKISPSASSTVLADWIQEISDRVEAMDLGVNPLSQVFAFTPSDPAGEAVTRSFSMSRTEPSTAAADD